MPDLTLEEIARRMDPVSPPEDLGALVHRHRAVEASSPGEEILRRHNHPETTTHRFLAFNTFLMPGVRVGLGLRGAARMALVAAQFGLLAGRSVGRLRARDMLAELRGTGASQRAHRDRRLSPLLARLDPGLAGERILNLGASADLDPRVGEVAEMVSREYDLAALCEVFTRASRERILGAARQQGRTVDHAVGPPKGPGVGREGSGLLGLCLGQPGARGMVRTAWRAFTRNGDPLREGDAWATKGVLLMEVDLGPGRLEIYCTHLLWGNDLLASDRRLLRLASPRLSQRRLLGLRLSQVDDLLAFYREQHDPRNVALVAGDFNMSAQDPGAYAALVERMASVSLRDAWPYPGRERPSPRGDTFATGNGGRLSRLEWLGPVDGQGCLDDGAAPPRPTGRIDYIFVEDPAPGHTFNLDLTRIRRRAFPREGKAQRYLSDHVGLSTTLIASPTS